MLASVNDSMVHSSSYGSGVNRSCLHKIGACTNDGEYTNSHKLNLNGLEEEVYVCAFVILSLTLSDQLGIRTLLWLRNPINAQKAWRDE